MTMRAVRGFDHETAVADLATNGTTFINGGGSINFVSGRTSGGKAIQFGAGYHYGILAVPLNAVVSSGTEVFIGGAATGVSGSGDTFFCIGVESPEGQLHAYVLFNGTNIIAYRAAPGETYFTEGSPTSLGSVVYAFPAGWTRIEVGIKVHATAGEIHVRVAGSATDILTVTGANTLGDTNSGMSGIAFAAVGSPSNTLISSNTGATWDDMYCCDSAGTVNNNFLGEGLVTTCFATADNTVQFARLSGGSNFAMVDETAMDSDTTYNASATAGQSDLFAHGGVATTFNIRAAQITNASRKDAAGTCSLANIISSNGIDETGATNPLATSYYYFSDIAELDPSTGAPWTVSGFNSTLIGYGRVA